MKRIVLWTLASLILLGVSATAVTASISLIPSADKAKEKAKVENSPVIERSGDHWALNPPGLERVVFIHYKKGHAKPPGAGKPPKAPACYDFLGRGVKWQTLPVNYVIDPDNQDGLTEDFVANAISLGAEEWDYYTSAELFGAYSIDYNSSWDSDAPDGRNELLFGDYPEPNVIAVTVVWGYFSGPPSIRKIVEFDVLFDTNWTWGDCFGEEETCYNSKVMDLQNIATHEIGHGTGLADIYESACANVTMYGYSTYGETIKRDLETPDITGIQTLYLP